MNKAGRPRKAPEKVMKTLCLTLMPSHIKWLVEKADELTVRQGHDVSASAVVRALIRHANRNEIDWNLE